MVFQFCTVLVPKFPKIIRAVVKDVYDFVRAAQPVGQLCDLVFSQLALHGEAYHNQVANLKQLLVP
jgi:hypothetical protein